MIDIINQYTKYLRQLDSLDEYIKKTYQRNNGINKIIDQYNGENVELLEYYRSLIGSQIQYNATVINLYGNYENFVTEICRAYLISKFLITEKFEELPVGLQEKYKTSVGEYLNNKQRFLNSDLNLNEVINNYNNFLKSDFSNIDYDLLLRHSANLSSNQLQEFLKELGIAEGKNIVSSDFLKKFYVENGLCDDHEYRFRLGRNKDLFKYLDDLVASRNLIAHTGEDSNRISAKDFVELTIPFLKSVARILLDFVVSALTMNFYCDTQIPIIHVFDNRILCISNNGINIKVGDIVTYKYDETVHNAIITRIQIDGHDVCETGFDVINVGLELDNRIKEDSQIIFIVDSAKSLKEQ